jgi:hypothetical protein
MIVDDMAVEMIVSIEKNKDLGSKAEDTAVDKSASRVPEGKQGCMAEEEDSR